MQRLADALKRSLNADDDDLESHRRSAGRSLLPPSQVRSLALACSPLHRFNASQYGPIGTLGGDDAQAEAGAESGKVRSSSLPVMLSLRLLSGQPKSSARLRSLDAFRGFSLAVMIFVNYGAQKRQPATLAE